MRAPGIAAATTITLASLLVGCPQAPSDPPPNLLLITVDTLRADHVAAYGEKEISTPHMDRLARAGVLFETAYCDVTWTLPSMASTLTGTYAYRHGVRFSFNRLPDAATSIAETLRGAGYATFAVVASFPLKAIYGLDQGFDRYSEPVFQSLRSRSDAEVTETALEAVADLAETPEPFFVWAHYFGPHARSDSDDIFRTTRRHVDSYVQKVMATDAAIGELLQGLAALGLEDDTLVVLHADHGESLGEHAFVGHGRYLYEASLRVPLILRWPGRIPAGQRVRGLVANVDIAATLLDAAGLSAEATAMDGRSLLPVIDRSGVARETLYIETYLPAQLPFAETVPPETKARRLPVRRHGLLSPPWKLIVTDRFSPNDDSASIGRGDLPGRRVRTEVYDLASDPDERAPDAWPPGASQVPVRLGNLLREHLEAGARLQAGESFTPSPEARDRLRDLGYLE